MTSDEEKATEKACSVQLHRYRWTRIVIMPLLLCMMDRAFLVSSFVPAAAAAAESRRSLEASSAPPRLLRIKDTSVLAARDADDKINNDDVKTSSIQFVASTSFRTESIPLPTPSSRLVEFFQSTENRNQLFLGNRTLLGGDIDDEASSLLPTVEPVMCSSSSPNLVSWYWDRWAKEAQYHGAGTPPPRPDVDKLLLVKSSGISFPLGLTMFVESIVGASLVLPSTAKAAVSSAAEQQSNNNQFPEYQFTLIKDTVRAEGPRIIVWTYNKIMGAKKGDHQTTHSYSTVSVKEHSKDRPGEIVFQSDARIEVNLSFPETLLRILPMSREQSNALGSQSIQSTFDEKGEASLHNFATAYREWSLMMLEQ